MASIKKSEPKTQVVAVAGTPGSIPAYLQGHKGGSGLQGLDMSDFIVPRIKLLQSVSPELKAFEGAKDGHFWLNVLDIPLGETTRFIPVSNRKRYLLMRPLGDSSGTSVLARADDAVHWNPPDGEWQVKIKGVKNPVTWKTADTVRASGLAELGSSNPDDPDSNPAATLLYEFLIFLPDHPEHSPTMLSLARSAAKRARDLQSKIEFRKAPMQSQMFEMDCTVETGPEGEYNNYIFKSVGFATEEQFDLCRELTERYQLYHPADEEGAAREGDRPKADSAEY